MGDIKYFRNQQICDVLEKVSRQYLVGDLKRPQELSYIFDSKLEIGITNYDAYSVEQVHYHSEATEYQYMISGHTKYLDVDKNIEYDFEKGDFYCIEKNTKYAQKSQAGTKILFIKVPSINDKHVVEKTDYVKDWYDKRL